MNAESIISGQTAAPSYTAAQIAAALGIKRQSVQWYLRGVNPAARRIVQGNKSAAWTVDQFPVALLDLLRVAASEQRCFKIETLLAMPRVEYAPALPRDQIADDIISEAAKLQEALRASLIQQHDGNISGAEFETIGLQNYSRVFGRSITARHWRNLFDRTVQRDNGAEDWDRLEIYLPDRLKKKVLILEQQPGSPAPAEALAQVPETEPTYDFADLEEYIANFVDPTNKGARAGVWGLALKKFQELVNGGESEKSASRRLRKFLFEYAPFLAASRNALRMAFERKMESPEDRRKDNGNRAEYPSEDIRRVRHSAVLKNGGRIDAAWREEFPRLSEYTRQRYARSRKCPRAFYDLVNREKVDALMARLHGKRTLRRLVGTVTRNAEGIKTMARWAVDDMTSNIEVVVYNRDGTVSLVQPQIIAVMDFASRKWVGWAMGNVKAPTAELVCEAILDGFKRHDVPRQLWLENGFVFGKSLAVNGKEDDQGRAVVSGLAQYGCAIHHYQKMNPTSKGELEKSFDLFQRRMERHPGYTGRTQMFDASEDFKREQLLIRSDKVDAKKFRYTYEEFVRVIHGLVEGYNAETQYGHLKGLSPNQAFEALKDLSDPPIKFNNQIHWMLANARYLVTVKASGVCFTHYGRKIKVRGGELARMERIGSSLWALVERRNDSLVTFMSLDYTETFTIETCQQPSAAESQIATGSSMLASELGKIGEHTLAVDDEFKTLMGEFGNPRRDLLAQIRNQPPAAAPAQNSRLLLVDPQLQDSANQMLQQREAIQQEKKERQLQTGRAARIMQRTGISVPEQARGNIQPDKVKELTDFIDGKDAE